MQKGPQQQQIDRNQPTLPEQIGGAFETGFPLQAETEQVDESGQGQEQQHAEDAVQYGQHAGDRQLDVQKIEVDGAAIGSAHGASRGLNQCS